MRCAAVRVSLVLMGSSGLALAGSGGLARYVGVCAEHGCVDCHVAYAQPIDLPHVVTADHFIRARLPRPEEVRAEVPHRQFLDPAGPMEVHDDGRLAPLWRTPAGERWRDGVRAMGLVSMSRFAEAAKGFSRFPAPGTPAARQPTGPAGLVPLETYPSFHHLRALTLQAQGDLAGAPALLQQLQTQFEQVHQDLLARIEPGEDS